MGFVIINGQPVHTSFLAMTPPTMSLEETRKELETLISGNQYSLHQVEIHALQSALHHLEAGKRDAERLDRLQSERWVDIRNKDEDWSEDGGRAAHTCIDLPSQRSAEGPTLRDAIDALPPQPSQQEGQ